MRMYHSLSRNQLKLLTKLKSGKHREKHGKFILEGQRSCEQAIQNQQLEIEYIILDSSKWGPGNEPFEIPTTIPRYLASKKDFDQLSGTVKSQGIALLATIPNSVSTQHFLNLNEGIILALDKISDPGNMGTIYRTAAWFGVKAIIPGVESVDLYNPKVTRSTAGATGIVPLINGDLIPILSTFKQSGWEVLSLELNDNAENISDISFSKRTILVIGNEANGVSNDVSALAKGVFIVGKSAFIESLNASIACGIALHTLFKKQN